MAEEKEFAFEEWLAEGIKGCRTSYKKLSPHLPEEFRQHTQAARREMLLACAACSMRPSNLPKKNPRRKPRRSR